MNNYRIRGLVIPVAFAVSISIQLSVDTGNAASTPKTITTCTNIKTNAMRLVAKGSCNKKTETTQMWIPKPSSIPSPSPLTSNNPNTAKFNEFFSDFYLGKMAIGKVIGTDGFPTKTNIFTKGVDLFCTMMSVKKTIAAGHLAGATYDVNAKFNIQTKTSFPMEIAAGGSVGCTPLNEPKGRYEDRIYIDDVLVAAIPFEVK